MTLQNVEQPGVSRVQKRTRKIIECASRQVDARDLRYVQNTQRSVRIGLRSGLKYDLCFGQTANIRFMNRIFRCLTYKQYKRDERERNRHVVVVPFGGERDSRPRSTPKRKRDRDGIQVKHTRRLLFHSFSSLTHVKLKPIDD